MLFSGSQALSNLLVAKPDWLGLLAPDGSSIPGASRVCARSESWLKPLLEACDFGGRWPGCVSSSSARCCASPRATWPGWATRRKSPARFPTWRMCASTRSGGSAGGSSPSGSASRIIRTPDGRWQPTAFCVLGMGKLGGQELNYSSDVDVMFVYSEEGQVFKATAGEGRARAGA